jgi:hypothetical protein
MSQNLTKMYFFHLVKRSLGRLFHICDIWQCEKGRLGLPWQKMVNKWKQGSEIATWAAWWLNGSAPDCCPAVPGSNPAPPQPTADCQSPGGLPPGMALGCGLTSVRGNRKENYKKWTTGSQETYKEKNRNCNKCRKFVPLENIHEFTLLNKFSLQKTGWMGVRANLLLSQH